MSIGVILAQSPAAQPCDRLGAGARSPAAGAATLPAPPAESIPAISPLALASKPHALVVPALVALLMAGTMVSASAATTPVTGGVPLLSGGLVPKPGQVKIPAPPNRHSRGRWLRSVAVTEYWPSPESWFVGRLVAAPGLTGLHRVDWLYSAAGVSMQGQGIGLDGRMYHIASLGSGGWVTAAGRGTSPDTGWAAGSPFWRAGGYWRNPRGGVTFPLAIGGWFAGPGRRYVDLPGVSFAPGPSLGLRFEQSLAVDPKVIPLGSRVYVPAYRHDGHGGWFIAQDTGGAVTGRHIDVYRRPPATATDPGRFVADQRIYVIRPRP